MTSIPIYVQIFVWIVLIVAAIIFVLAPLSENLQKASEMHKKRWERKFRKLHPELFKKDEKKNEK